MINHSMHRAGNKALLAIYPGDANDLYTQFKAFSINYINEMHRYTHGRDLIVDAVSLTAFNQHPLTGRSRIASGGGLGC